MDIFLGVKDIGVGKIVRDRGERERERVGAFEYGGKSVLGMCARVCVWRTVGKQGKVLPSRKRSATLSAAPLPPKSRVHWQHCFLVVYK